MSKMEAVARALVGRRWWWVTILVIALMIVLARLGFWQLDRLEQRRAANAELRAALQSAPFDLNDRVDEYSGVSPGDIPTDLTNRDVLASGSFDYDNQRILKLQSYNGMAGVHLITPFVLEGTDTAVLVNRGWIPDAAYAAGEKFADETGARTIEGYVALTETLMRRTADAVVPVSPGLELFRVDIAAVEEELPYQLVPFYLVLPPEGSIRDELPVRVPKEVDLSEGPHLDYALQWFIFSIGLGVAYVIFVNRSLNQTAPKEKEASAEVG